MREMADRPSGGPHFALHGRKIMAYLLAVDDEKDIVELISRFAEHEGHTVDTAENGAQALSLCQRNDYDLIILDIMMPEMDGFTFCKKLREEKKTPVIMLSALGAEYDKLMGFELGIDDYVVKPFSPRELMARVRAVLARNPSGRPKDEIVIQGIRMDVLSHEVYVDGVKTELTAKEYELLSYLIQNKGIALTRENILNAVWGYDYFGDDRTVDWQIKLLRGKLGPYRKCIVTLRGTGYRFDEKA